ncbi:2Fe-2S ferredoxin-like [Halichondria panicea]|uniref:2Fe-2S ferredoxin-like n=1 Tax=Halichondria panicea TaxID=6063 RepID=UPI00312BBB9D
MTNILRNFLSRSSLLLPSLQLPTMRAMSVLSSSSMVRPSHCIEERSTILLRSFSSSLPSLSKKTVPIIFTDRDGDVHTVQAKIGDTLLEVAKEFDIDVEGACEGTLSCSTCHLILDPEWFDKILDPLTEEEQDMLDLAYHPTDTSRLGCQILVGKDLEGLKVTVPSATRDIRN